MKSLVIVATTLMLVSNALPASADPGNSDQPNTTKHHVVRLFHAPRKLALKESASNSAESVQFVLPMERSLDFSTDEFVIN